MNIEELKGEVLTNIDVAGDEIMLTTQSGRKVRIFHCQDCCESVSIHGIDGEVTKLLGKPLLDVSETNPDDAPAEGSDESYTWTVHEFRVDDATVIVRWFGSSNGYYSESVSIADLGQR